MTEDDLGKIVDAWIAGALFGRTEDGRSTPAYEENWWAIEKVINWKYDNEPEPLWRFILAVHEKDISEKVAGHLAAGPVEDLLSEFGDAYIERIENMARKDARFRRMLWGVWQDAMSDELWSRLQKARSAFE